MRVYRASSEETVRARQLLKDWSGQGLLTTEQYQRLEKETVSELRTTNIFLRLVLFVFTLISVGAAIGLFFVVFLPRSSNQTSATFLLIFAFACYVAAELSASRARLYRYGIEEALAACSVGFLCFGVEDAFFSSHQYSPLPDPAQSMVPAAGVLLSLWIWRRFGLWYALLAAMIFAIFLPGYWTSSLAARHVIVVLFYAVGLIWVAVVRSRHRFDYLEETYSHAEALLWLGIYLAINLKLSSLALDVRWLRLGTLPVVQFASLFYWATWVFIWCLPPVILARGIRLKDHFVIAVGAIAAILTLVTNKPYLGWQRHTWDPMLLGLVLTGVVFFIRRWLTRGPGGIRRGFTAASLSGKDRRWINAGSTVLGLASPQSITPSPQTTSPDFRFGGGETGGGGAGGKF